MKTSSVRAPQGRPGAGLVAELGRRAGPRWAVLRRYGADRTDADALDPSDMAT